MEGKGREAPSSWRSLFPGRFSVDALSVFTVKCLGRLGVAVVSFFSFAFGIHSSNSRGGFVSVLVVRLPHTATTLLN